MMKTRKLGTQGLEVAEIGLGCMPMTGFPGMEAGVYGQIDVAEAEATLLQAVELGVNFFDTAELYGPFKNEELVGRVLAPHRNRVQLATKFAMDIGEDGVVSGLNSSPAHIKQVVEQMLKRLRTDHIDLLYQHRLDPNTPIEDTAGAVRELIREGKVRYFGLSEVGPSIIRRAHAVQPVSALQSEYSIWERGVESDILPTLRELGIGFVPYSPLGRGYLTGTVKPGELDAGEYRNMDPRMQADSAAQNEKIVDTVKQVARAHGATPAQVALAWLLQQGVNLVPIPGTKRRKYLAENVKASEVHLSDAELKTLGDAGAQVIGQRYAERGMASIHRD